MIESDTLRLLRECDAGIKMGVASIGEVTGHVKDAAFREQLNVCKSGHEHLGRQVEALLREYRAGGKSPSPVARGMSWLKTNVMLAAGGDDKSVADLMTDGCNMGVKSLSRYLNQYEAADETSKDIAKRLIGLEKQLCDDIRRYL